MGMHICSVKGLGNKGMFLLVLSRDYGNICVCIYIYIHIVFGVWGLSEHSI